MELFSADAKINIELKCHGVRLDECVWPLTASLTSEVKINMPMLSHKVFATNSLKLKFL